MSVIQAARMMRLSQAERRGQDIIKLVPVLKSSLGIERSRIVKSFDYESYESGVMATMGIKNHTNQELYNSSIIGAIRTTIRASGDARIIRIVRVKDRLNEELSYHVRKDFYETGIRRSWNHQCCTNQESSESEVIRIVKIKSCSNQESISKCLMNEATQS